MPRHASSGLDGQHAARGRLPPAQPVGHGLRRNSARGGERSLAADLLDCGLKGAVPNRGTHGPQSEALLDRVSSITSLRTAQGCVSSSGYLKPCFMRDLRDLLQQAIDESGMSKADIARAMGVSPQAVGGWLKTGRIGKKTLVRLAELTRFPVVRLLGGQENTASMNPEISQVPLISWVQAGHKNPVSDPFPVGAPEEWQEVGVPVSKRAFALRVRGDSMIAPDGSGFPEGSVIVVDPSLEARNGDYVVVRFQDSDEATFKRLIVDGPNKLLKPLNPAYPMIPVTDDARLAGVVVEHRMSRRLR